MANNVLAPMGAVFSRNLISAAPTFQANVYTIQKTYTTAIGIGDMVKTGTGGAQGYINLSGASDSTGLGVFAGVLPYYDSTIQGTSHGLIGSWPTTAAPTQDVQCLVISDPFAVFRIQLNGNTVWSPTYRGLNVKFTNNGAPNAAGVSTLALDSTNIATTNTFPFRIIGLAGFSGGPTDPANGNPWLECTLNPAWAEQLVGTGI